MAQEKKSLNVTDVMVHVRAMRWIQALLICSTTVLLSAHLPADELGEPDTASAAPAEPAAMATDEARYDTASYLLALGDYEGALAQLDRIDEREAANANVFNLRGTILARQQKWDEATASMLKALATDPRLHIVHFNLAEIYFQLARYAEARQHYEAYLRQEPGNQLSRYKVLLSYLLEEQSEDAQNVLETFSEEDLPIYHWAHAAWNLAEGHYEAADYFIAASRSLFNPEVLRPYASALVDAGWLPPGDAL